MNKFCGFFVCMYNIGLFGGLYRGLLQNIWGSFADCIGLVRGLHMNKFCCSFQSMYV